MTTTTQQLGGLAMGSGHGSMPSPILSLSKSRLKIKTLVLSSLASRYGLKEAD